VFAPHEVCLHIMIIQVAVLPLGPQGAAQHATHQLGLWLVADHVAQGVLSDVGHLVFDGSGALLMWHVIVHC
jgi:hypothetical protein